jgi:hypothetical protein
MQNYCKYQLPHKYEFYIYFCVINPKSIKNAKKND